jgi:hypothetical protein
MKTTLLFVLVVLAFRVCGQATPADIPAYDIPAYEYYEPFIETVYVHDTIYVSDADEFLRKYYNGPLNINALVRNRRLMDSTLRQLSHVSGEKLFYNFFERQRFPRALSNNIVIKEFVLNPDFNLRPLADYTGADARKGLSRELLFRFEGRDRTNRFLNDDKAIVRAISYMFTQLQQDSTVRSLDLYFPDFDFRDKHAMAQFVKSIDLVRHASKDFNPERMNVKVFFHKPADKSLASEGFLYAIMLKAGEVVLLDGTEVMDNFYVYGDAMTRSEVEAVGFLTRMRSHFYLARFHHKDVEIQGRNLTDFSPASIHAIVHGDFPENNWEPYMWGLIGIFCFAALLSVLYFIFPPLALMLNQNLGVVLMCSIVLIIEIIFLFEMMFENMCFEDESTSITQNPSLLFCMPIVMVIVVPILRQVARGRKLP